MTITRKTKSERLELLKQQKVDLEQRLKAKTQKLAARIKAIEVKDITQSRKIDTRRKILLGAMIMHRVEKGEFTNDWISEKMDGFLSRGEDRVLFGLERKNPVVSKSDVTDLDNQSDCSYDN